MTVNKALHMALALYADEAGRPIFVWSDQFDQ